MKKMKKYFIEFVKDAINSEEFDELPEFLWLWDDFLLFIIKEKVNQKNFCKFWKCIKRSLNREHYGALLDAGISFEMMGIMEMNDPLFEAGLKRKWFHKTLLRYVHLLKHHQIVTLFVEGEFDKKSLEILYDNIIESELTPEELVRVMCKCQNTQIMKDCVEKIPNHLWRDDAFLTLIAKGKPAYRDEDLYAILMKIISNQICLDINKIVDIFGYSIFTKVFKPDDNVQKLMLYSQTMNEHRDMGNDQWQILIDAYSGDIDKAIEDLERYGYVPTKSQMEALKEANEAE
ncbi:MAG: hypothetical protein J6K42_04405 [Clostridia bacterium]|nr:hypothetical protein [Clostridia bacterium]